MGFSSDQAILLSAPPYFYAVLPVLISSFVGDRYQLRGAVVVFNCACTIVGFGMLGFSKYDAVRYVGTYLATGGYVSNVCISLMTPPFNSYSNTNFLS